jgi:predicted aspartyl protease
MVVTGCAGLRTSLQGVSGPVAWQVTDLRMVERAVEGTARDLYTFTLVLQETRSAMLTFTSLEQTISDPVLYPTGVSQQASVLWKLHPHGEFRCPFSVYSYCAMDDCPRNLMPPAPWYALALTGTDDRGQPVRVTMDFKLPMSPAGPKIAPAPATASPSPPGPAVASQHASGPVPFQTIYNHIRLHAVLNHKEQVTLFLDTGVTHTLITPDTAKRLGLSPTAETPKQALHVLGGHQVEVPVVLLASVAVGQTAVQNVPVGVVASFPADPLADGLLGADVLRHFTLTLDYAASRLTLVPQGPQSPSPATLAAARGVVHGPIPLRLGPSHVLVQAILNGQEPVTLLLDTGASHTLLTPATARRLGLSPTADALRRR